MFKYVFLGGEESEFAQIVLDGMIAGGMKPAHTIRNAKAPFDIPLLKSLNTDFFLVASFAKILKKDVIDIPRKGTIALHPSLLPKLRGASPIQSALLEGYTETGTTLFIVDEKVDHGPIIAQKSIAIDSKDAYITLMPKLAQLSADVALEAIPRWIDGSLKPQIQNELLVTLTKKFVGGDGFVNLQKDSVDIIMRKIKALNPEPGVFTVLNLTNGKKMRLKLLDGQVTDKKLELTKVQPEGKKPMSYQAFLNGYQKLLQ
ncbi:MAG: methionyl-tRNA formyltransferase [bacterium]|nr:methionyl-tRNA formyltransferase [bacterium]